MPRKYTSDGARALEGRAGIVVGASYLESATADPTSALTFLHWSRDALDTIEAGQLEAVGIARGDGASWSEIGRMLGMTKQAAQQRFGRTSSTNRDAMPGQATFEVAG